ncbi:NAD(P)-dependent oxidoreductase, partial [Glycomyces tenuis]|uniref:NAD(P)-dependent oxidoreductase n=1 Tax=Glycomyces tenuis TaxID=58116 RepID=UPI00146FF31E
MAATKSAYPCRQLHVTEEADVSVYEVGLRLEGKAVLVVGGGTIAARRVPRLLEV